MTARACYSRGGPHLAQVLFVNGLPIEPGHRRVPVLGTERVPYEIERCEVGLVLRAIAREYD